MTDKLCIAKEPNRYLGSDQFETDSLELSEILRVSNPEQWKKIMEEGDVDIEPNFMGFVTQYKLLSLIIPLDYKVMDFGCAYAPQSYYFRNHKEYWGIDHLENDLRFSSTNTVHIVGDIRETLSVLTDFGKNFAICSYVNTQAARVAVRNKYRNVFCYYP